MPQTFPGRKKVAPEEKSEQVFAKMDLTALLRERCLSLFMDMSFSSLMIPRTSVTFSCVSDCLGSEPEGRVSHRQWGWVRNKSTAAASRKRARVFSITFPLFYLKFNTPVMGVFPFISMDIGSVAALTCTCICIFTWTFHRLKHQKCQKPFASI